MASAIKLPRTRVFGGRRLHLSGPTQGRMDKSGAQILARFQRGIGKKSVRVVQVATGLRSAPKGWAVYVSR